MSISLPSQVELGRGLWRPRSDLSKSDFAPLAYNLVELLRVYSPLMTLK